MAFYVEEFVNIMTDELGLTSEQKQGFHEYIESIDHLIQCAGGRLRSRQIIALALVMYCKQEGI